MHDIAFRPATDQDWPAIAGLLTEAGLTLAGAREHLSTFITAWAGDQPAGDRLAGVAGLEVYGDAALLRSVAVAPDRRGTGLGQELVLRLLETAYGTGVRTVGLLTDTAAGFYPRFGFLRVDRTAFPPALRTSEEFRSACPVSAAAMLLSLAHPPMLVRPWHPADIPAITAIYNQGIEDRATLETELRTTDERTRWLEARGERHPVLVAVRRDQVIGWASLNPFSAREAYRHVADLSVYVDRAARGTGAGKALMAALIETARRRAYHKLVLATFPQSTAAVALYTSLGFRHVGDYREQGLLDGRWTDTRVMELLL